ncbi:MAG TPA: hypothetical protein PLW34_01120 [Termitinemataceae bacterium]|jgi:hypothetical protein|uniref:hypothetical protein n=1 Tax=Treponema sp. J25 TaxID=2094121 RepID=UPI00104B38DF|nr:hypothetical protein [Treponema sp. J25]TCW60771.1 hypothetical protein C5O22_09900 [Treponema sp. J25]HOJ98148.1 hypothetical protein [Termitinemataceae bacterium]HOM22442.1 hypothetical protein [Termitinemataceae bacterium]HPP99558.1 hypothetical protein [Termitinemataceae bacterium]
MIQKIHIEDTIFFINSLIRLIEQTSQLEISADLFAEHLVTTIDTITVALDQIGNFLLANDRFVDREEQLKNLIETDEYFTRVLGLILEGNTPITRSLIPISDRFVTLRQHRIEWRAQFQNQLAQPHLFPEEIQVVSSAEMEELLRGM